jgi:hypothetical protein
MTHSEKSGNNSLRSKLRGIKAAVVKTDNRGGYFGQQQSIGAAV